MIEKLTLKNFQSHKHSELEFAPGLNAIIGQSDSGKSALLRALRWIVTNRPSGDAFRSDWGGDTEATVQMAEGTITRYKNDSGNGYLLGGSKFQAIGTGVPDEIINTLAIDDVNIQQQLDRPFLLDDSPGEVAQHFNRVARLDKIDTSIQIVQSQIRKINAEIIATRSIITNGEIDLEQYAFLPAFEADLVALEEVQSKARDYSDKITFVKQRINAYKNIEEEEEEYKAIVRLGDDVSGLLGKVAEHKIQNTKISKIKKLVDSIKNCEVSIVALGDGLKRKIEEFETAFPDICPLCGQEVRR